MKFLCDRCNTRYSIGDDRVRGKILKIRCKNCANVITVREGMTADPDGNEAARTKKPTTVAPPALPADLAADAASETSDAANERVRAPGRLDRRGQPAGGDPDGAAGAGDAARGIGRPGVGAQGGPGKEAAAPRGPVGAGVGGTSSGNPGSSAGTAKEQPARPAARPVATRQTAGQGASGAAAAAGAPAKRTTRADEPARGQAQTGRRAGAGAGPRVESSSALGEAFASAMARPQPPPALEEEWYVSIDGEQAGPFSLSEAQRWVAQKPFEAELHCWSEGFDDWLPVDKVSHFRGLRKRPSSAAPPLPLPRPVAPAQAGPAAPPAPPEPPAEPRPLFADTMAQLERGSHPGPPPSEAPGIHNHGRPGHPAARDARHASAAAPLPQPGPARATPPLGTPVPAGARTNGAVPRGLHGAPFDTSEDSDPGAELTATRYREPGDLPGRAAGGPSPAVTPAPPPTTSDLRGAVVSAPASDFESDAHGDDLHIGEVSRVVNLADIARPPPRGGPGGRATTQGRPLVGPAGRLTTQSASLRSPGAQPESPPDPAAPGASDGEPGAMAPAARTHHRGLIALLSVAVVLVLGVAGAVVLLVTTSDELVGGALGTVHNIDTSRPEDPITKRPIETGSAAPPRPAAPRPNPPTAAPPPIASNPAALPPGGSLRSDEIEDVARKHQDMTQRCYMRSQRGADAVLVGDVKKIAVTLTIDREGVVTDLELSDHAGDNLGRCLIGSIKTWRFRPSAGGTFRFSLNFVSG